MAGMPYSVLAQAPPWNWAKGVHTNSAEYATDIAFDPSSGNVVEVGVFNSDLSSFFGSRFIGAIGGGYVVKYDPTGAVIWAFPIGNNQDDACNGVTVDGSGNIFVTGYLQQIADFKGTNLLSTVLFSNGGKDIFVAKYNSAGQLLWVTQAGNATDDEGTAVSVNANGVYITGYYTGAANFGGTGPTLLTGSDKKGYVAAFDVNGNNLWYSTIGNTGTDAFGKDICVDNSSVFITGIYEGSSANFYHTNISSGTLNNANPSKYDGFTASFTTASGVYNWCAGIHSNNDDFSNGITLAANNLYITGATSANANFTGYASNPAASGANGLDLFTAQLNKSTGNANWIKSEPSSNGNHDEEGKSISVDTTNLLTVTGFFNKSINFIGGTSITSSGNEDVFVVAYDTAGNFKWATQAGDNGTDIGHAITTGGLGEIYVAGEYEQNAVFGATTLIQDGPPNIFTAKIGCPPIINNTITNNQSVCSNQLPATLTGSSPSGAAGSFNFLWQQSPDNITWSAATATNNTQNYSPTLLASNTYYRRVVLATAGCYNTLNSNSLLISVSQIPSTAIVMADDTICSGTVVITANNPTSGTGKWTVIAGTSTVTTPSSYSTTANGLSVGLNKFVWTISTGTVCAVSKDTLKVLVDNPPSPANAGVPQTHCTTTNATLTANNPAVGNGMWTITSGTANITSPTSNTTTVTGLNIGSTIFKWTIKNGTCPSSTSTVSVNTDALPSAASTAGSQTICASTTTISANNPTVGTGVWLVTSGTANITSPSTNTTSITGLNVGQTIFKWKISNGTCPASTATMSVKVDAMPSVANAGSPQALCAASNANLAAVNPSVGSGVWSVISGTANITSPTTNTTGVTSLNTGQTIFKWTVTNGTCPSTTSTVSINVDALPSQAVTTGPKTLCAVTTSTINANIPAVGTGVWSVVSGTGNVAIPSSNTSGVNNLSNGSNNFVWTISNGVCPSSKDTFKITEYALPAVAITGSYLICNGTSTILTGNGANTYTWSGGITTNSITVSPTSNTTYSVTGTNTLTGCSNSAVQLVVVKPVSASSQTINICATDTLKVGGNNHTTSGNYTDILTAANGCDSTVTSNLTVMPAIISTQSFSICVGQVMSVGASTYSTTGVYTNTLTSVFSGCDSIVITNLLIEAFPTVANAGHDTILYNTDVTLDANTPVIGTGVWLVISGDANFVNSLNPHTQVTGLNNGQTILQWTISNGSCPASKDELTIIIKALIIPNGFSPNGDGVNDTFVINGLDEFTNVKINLFNRWGSMIYDSNDYKNNWNGKNLSGEEVTDDTYYYTIEIPNKKTYKGYVVLKRK